MDIPILLCSLCGKPFAQERQHRRHQTYCRKAQHRARARPRSCRACNQAKIKCNFRAPCHQCSRKGIFCEYEKQHQRDRVLNHEIDGLIRVQDVSSTDGPGPASPANVVADAGLESAHNSLRSHHSEYSFDNDDFIMAATASHSSTQSNPITSSPITTLSPPSSGGFNSFMSVLQPSDLGFIGSFSSGKDVDFIFQPDPLLPPTFPCSQISTEVAHFSRNRLTNPVHQLFTSMVTDMIRAYPIMMTRRETFPPFVHPHCCLYEESGKLPPVLTNCMGIAQLFVARTDDTRHFVWTTIRAEVRDIVERCPSMNIYELFSALQASLMYMIMRAIDDLPFRAEQDLELIRAHEIICESTMRRVNRKPGPESNNPRRKWREWILDESIKRVAWVWFMLGLVYHIRTETPCLVADITPSVPLPCTKNEWEAQAEEDWREEYNKARKLQTASSLLIFGDLMEAHTCSSTEMPNREKELEIWNAGIDNLGVLLNLAVYIDRGRRS